MSQNIIKIPEGTGLSFRCTGWDDTSKDEIRDFNEKEYKIFGEGIFKDEEYYYIDVFGYSGVNYFMVKKQDLLPYLKEESYEIY